MAKWLADQVGRDRSTVSRGDPGICRVSYRLGWQPADPNNIIAFRLVLAEQ